jgi:TPR repeat protein
MSPLKRTILLLGLTAALGLAQAAQPGDAEGSLQQQVQQALWPADIVASADQYLNRYPQGPFAAQARALREQAAPAVRVLSRRDVRLYRSAFQTPADDGGARDELRRAALGDRQAAVRLAHGHQRGEGGLPQDFNRYVGWLQYAAYLGDERASYELALHYRRDAQPVLAAMYEARAVELGFTPPRDLDHIRK